MRVIHVVKITFGAALALPGTLLVVVSILESGVNPLLSGAATAANAANSPLPALLGLSMITWGLLIVMAIGPDKRKNE